MKTKPWASWNPDERLQEGAPRSPRAHRLPHPLLPHPCRTPGGFPRRPRCRTCRPDGFPALPGPLDRPHTRRCARRPLARPGLRTTPLSFSRPPSRGDAAAPALLGLRTRRRRAASCSTGVCTTRSPVAPRRRPRPPRPRPRRSSPGAPLLPAPPARGPSASRPGCGHGPPCPRGQTSGVQGRRRSVSWGPYRDQDSDRKGGVFA